MPNSWSGSPQSSKGVLTFGGECLVRRNLDSGAPICRQCHDGLKQKTFYQAMRLAQRQKLVSKQQKAMGGLCAPLSKVSSRALFSELHYLLAS